MISPEIMPSIKPGATVRVHEILKEAPSKAVKVKKGETRQIKTRISMFEGIVLARKHGSEPGATFTVRATVAGEGVEKVYPLHSPMISKVDILTTPNKVHRAKLYYLRTVSHKKARQKLGIAGF